MTRKLVMIRHAKSSWANLLQSDFERPLNERGKKEAPEMGAVLKEKGFIPDIIISSKSKRTRQTAKKIASALGYDFEKVVWDDRLYHCIPSVFEEIIYEMPEHIGSLFIIAHNPGITEFVNHLSPHFSIENMPTCGVVGVSFESAEWNEFPIVNKNVILYEYPAKP
ncbi:MAG: histidine phosphatase family protein [Taibaiella sp.]|nr:histidine phosphatase family protein [Taibaiella sp.]